jgi:secretion/DNA translocation related CpaE-like protein
LDDLLRLASDAGVTADVAADPAGARRWYPDADQVYVGADMASACARAGLPRRIGVIVVIREGAPGATTSASRLVRDGARDDTTSAGRSVRDCVSADGAEAADIGAVDAARHRRSHGGDGSVVRDGSGAGGRSAVGSRPSVAGRSGVAGRAGVGGRSGVGGPPDTDWEAVQRLGAEHVAVLPAAEPWLVDQLAAFGAGGVGATPAAMRTPASATTRAGSSTGMAGVTGAADARDSAGSNSPAAAGPGGGAATGRVVAVLGGRGGAGASILAGGLAVTAARRGLRTMLVDADPLGGGVDLVLGWESLDGLRWPALSQASGEVPAPALVEALPGRSELVILSWDRGEPMTVPPEAMLAALDAGRRGRDLTIVDIPRRLDESAMLALRAADQVYLVVPAELRACAAAARVAAVAGPHCAALSVVVRQPGPAGLAVKEVIAALRLPYAGTIRSEPRLRTAWERGEPPAASGHGSLATLCRKLLDDVVPGGALSDRATLGCAASGGALSGRDSTASAPPVGVRSANGVARDRRPAPREESA